jgi:hypothetical protein
LLNYIVLDYLGELTVMVKTDFIDLYESLNILNEDYTLEAHGYKVGDLVELENFGYKPSTDTLHGVVLDLFENQTVTKLIGVLLLGGDHGVTIADTQVNEILRKISEKDLTDEEKTNYAKRGKPACEKRIKELSSKDSNNEADGQEKADKMQVTEPRNAKLNKARQNNSKIMKAFKEVGLPTNDLVTIAKNKNGRDYKKASDKLNKLRKTLFGEAFEEELDNPFDQEF